MIYLTKVEGAETSTSIWSAISRLYSKLSTNKVMHLHCQLRSMKKGTMFMREYTMKIKEVCDLLATCGNFIYDIEQITTI
ncbi:hypothetical protein GQ457_08G025450 [Hibiscus cannabinus]